MYDIQIKSSFEKKEHIVANFVQFTESHKPSTVKANRPGVIELKFLA